jgi:hypothetical protein
MELLNKSKNLDEKEFIMRAENGYTLYVQYSYIKEGEKHLLFYILSRYPTKRLFYEYELEILEGIENFDFQDGVCTEREARIEFHSIQKQIEYLKKKEDFKIEDWRYSKQGKNDFEKDRKEQQIG